MLNSIFEFISLIAYMVQMRFGSILSYLIYIYIYMYICIWCYLKCLMLQKFAIDFFSQIAYTAAYIHIWLHFCLMWYICVCMLSIEAWLKKKKWERKEGKTEFGHLWVIHELLMLQLCFWFLHLQALMVALFFSYNSFLSYVLIT